jgi:uncharacterized protein YqeY
MEPLRRRIQEDMKAALRARDKRRLGIVRLILAAIQQREVDERIELDETQALAVLDRMIKQRRDSLAQFQAGGRQDLADQEGYEIEVIQSYLPPLLSATELNTLVEEVVREMGARSPQDMGKVMGALKPRIQGRADMRQASDLVRDRLQGRH